MKKLTFLAFIAFAFIVSGCGKARDLADINVDIPYSNQVNIPEVSGYPAGTVLPGGGLDVPFPGVSFATNSKDYISQYHTSADKIRNVYLKTLAIDMVTPPNGNFDFLDNIQIYISANGQPEMLVASQYNIAKGQSTLTLVTNADVNLKSYFLQDVVNLRIQAHVNALPPSATQLTIKSVFHLVANPLY
jgi:hypothetical protein